MSYAEIDHIALSGLIFVGATSAALLLRWWGLRTIEQWSRRTETRLDDFVLEAVRLPSVFWAIAAGLYAAVGVSNLPEKSVSFTFNALHILVALTVMFILANLLPRFFIYSARKAEIPIPASGLSQVVIKGVVIATGVLILLGTLGISITPLLTALGVGGLAVALALQDTLGNLFAGVHILMEKSIRIGDFVRLESGQEGYVADIGWRTTRVRLLPNNMVIIPNSKLAQSIVTNYCLPETRMSLLIPISVSYDSDPEKVEKILIEEAVMGAKEIPGMLSDPAPFVRFIPGFGDSSLDFTLICQVKEFVDQYLAQHEMRKRIFKRFRNEGIRIPYPARTVYLKRQ